MSNVRLTWDLPTPTPRQRPIDYVLVQFRVDASLPWTDQAQVLATDPQELLFVDAAPGEMFYQVIAVDDGSVSGPPAETSATVAFDAPDAVLNLVATVE